MKRRLNLYCTILIVISMFLVVENMGEAALTCFDMGRGVSQVDISQPGWIAKLIFLVADLSVLLIAGLLIVWTIRNINRSVVFHGKNARLFQLSGKMLVFHALLLWCMNAVDVYVLSIKEAPALVNYHVVLAALFLLVVAEIFAIGLRLQEEQDLTI